MLLGISVVTIRSSLAPLLSLSRQAGAIGPASVGIRLPEDRIPREILPLVHAVNRAFERLEDGLRLQREFTADAAHELRTPLAVLGVHIDTLADREAATALRRDLDAMARLVTQLLKAAQVEALLVAPGEMAELGAVAAEVAAWLAPMAVAEGRSIELVQPDHPVDVRGNAEAILHAIRNLLENALAHTPRGTTVTITVAADPPRVMVRDHGPGVPAELRDRVFQRFWRAQHRRTGTGLGLAIVRRTMEAHGGTAHLEDSGGTGALFVLEFPDNNGDTIPNSLTRPAAPSAGIRSPAR